MLRAAEWPECCFDKLSPLMRPVHSVTLLKLFNHLYTDENSS